MVDGSLVEGRAAGRSMLRSSNTITKELSVGRHHQQHNNICKEVKMAGAMGEMMCVEAGAMDGRCGSSRRKKEKDRRTLACRALTRRDARWHNCDD